MCYKWLTVFTGYSYTLYIVSCSAIYNLATLLSNFLMGPFREARMPRTGLTLRLFQLMLAVHCLLGVEVTRSQAQERKDETPRALVKLPEGPFVVKPYLQLGRAPKPGCLNLDWHAVDTDIEWAVEYRHAAVDDWRTAKIASPRRIAVAGVEPHRVYRAVLTDLEGRGPFHYRIKKGTDVVFEAEGKALKGPKDAYRFVAFGDCGAGTPEEKAIAYQASLEKPDFVMIPGDIIYPRGQIRDYHDKFWPVYNADQAGATQGALLLRSTLFVAAPGNHDIAATDMGRFPDGLAYFYCWDQPLTGIPGEAAGSRRVPALAGPEENKTAFLDAAGGTYPRMRNFSFDYANAHWMILDSNPYIDPTDKELRAWLASDLAAAKGATWRFVVFHHPGFSSSREHYEQQHMRQLAELFEAGAVDVVFNGHVHNYQRSYPFRFTAGPNGDDKPLLGKSGKPITGGKLMVPGRFRLDKSFDGSTRTRADGVIYIVTGAGGQHLYDPDQQDEPSSWQDFTQKFVSKVHSLTVADVDGADHDRAPGVGRRPRARSICHDQVKSRVCVGPSILPLTRPATGWFAFTDRPIPDWPA